MPSCQIKQPTQRFNRTASNQQTLQKSHEPRGDIQQMA